MKSEQRIRLYLRYAIAMEKVLASMDPPIDRPENSGTVMRQTLEAILDLGPEPPFISEIDALEEAIARECGS